MTRPKDPNATTARPAREGREAPETEQPGTTVDSSRRLRITWILLAIAAAIILLALLIGGLAS